MPAISGDSIRPLRLYENGKPPVCTGVEMEQKVDDAIVVEIE